MEEKQKRYISYGSVMPASIIGSKQEYRKATGKVYEAESKEKKEHTKKTHKAVKELEHSLMKPTKGLHFSKMKRSVF